MEILNAVMSIFTDGISDLERVCLFVGAITLVIGIIRFFASETRTGGVLTIITGLFFSCSLLIVANNDVSVGMIIIIAVIALGLIALCWIRLYNSSKESFATSLVLSLLILVLIAFYLENKTGIREMADNLSLLDWAYTVLLIFFGLWVLPTVGRAISLGAEMTGVGHQASDDPSAWATGDERSVDTTAMSDFDD